MGISPWKKCPSKHDKKFFNLGQAWNTTLKRLRSLASQAKEKTVDFNALLQDASTNQNKERENSRKERTVFIPKEHMCCIRRAVDQDPCKQVPFTS